MTYGEAMDMLRAYIGQWEFGRSEPGITGISVMTCPELCPRAMHDEVCQKAHGIGIDEVDRRRDAWKLPRESASSEASTEPTPAKEGLREQIGGLLEVGDWRAAQPIVDEQVASLESSGRHEHATGLKTWWRRERNMAILRTGEVSIG